MSVPAKTRRLKSKYIDRSPRVDSEPARAPGYVQYTASHYNADTRGAQFGDVSDTGMRLISRLPVKEKVGDIVNLEFTLPGNESKIESRALIVRQSNEYEFAVRFQETEGPEKRSRQLAVNRYVEFLRSSSQVSVTLKSLVTWAAANRQGLWISAVGLFIFGGIATYIYLSSDAYLGNAIRPWGGEALPKQWFLDYVNHYTKPSK